MRLRYQTDNKTSSCLSISNDDDDDGGGCGGSCSDDVYEVFQPKEKGGCD